MLDGAVRASLLAVCLLVFVCLLVAICCRVPLCALCATVCRCMRRVAFRWTLNDLCELHDLTVFLTDISFKLSKVHLITPSFFDFFS